MALLDELFIFITSGSIAGLPTLVVMAIPFIIGLVVGLLVKKFLKIALIIVIIVALISYLGLFTLSLSDLENLAIQYGPLAIHFAVLMIGILPLSIGFVIGLIVSIMFG